MYYRIHNKLMIINLIIYLIYIHSISIYVCEIENFKFKVRKNFSKYHSDL